MKLFQIIQIASLLQQYTFFKNYFPITIRILLFQGAKTGKDNGYTMLFDIESFDYSYYDEGSEGLKVALVHHLDMPIMRQTGFHIAPGTENQIAGEYITFDGPKNQKIKCHLL